MYFDQEEHAHAAYKNSKKSQNFYNYGKHKTLFAASFNRNQTSKHIPEVPRITTKPRSKLVHAWNRSFNPTGLVKFLNLNLSIYALLFTFDCPNVFNMVCETDLNQKNKALT